MAFLFKTMNLRTKTLWIMGGATLVLFVITITLSSWAVTRGFLAVETSAMRRDISRARNALQSDLDDLASKVADWAVWDDSYEFIETHDPGFVASNLGGSVFSDLQLSAVIFIDPTGSIVYSQWFDLSEEKREPIPEDLRPFLAPNTFLTTHADWTDTHKGIVTLSSGPLMIVSRPIVTSLGEGPFRGTVVFARQVSEGTITRISQVSHLDIAMISAKHAVDNAIIRMSLTEISGTALIRDISGNPAFGLRVTVLREIFGQGLASLRVFLIAIIFAISIFSIMLFIVLRQFIISRITKLSDQIADIGKRENFSKRVTDTRAGDEIGQLGGAFNATLDAFQKSRDLLAEAKAKDDAILGSMGESVIVMDKSGKLVYANDAARELLAIGPKDTYELYDPVTGKLFAKNKSPLARVLAGKIVTKTDVLVKNSSLKRDILTSANGRPVKMPNGKMLGAVMTFRDVSKEKEVDKAKTEFVSLASHQLRTPLAAVNWYIEMLLSGDGGKLTKTQKQYLNEAYAGNQRMGELVNALLNVSRLELGTFAVEPEKTDVLAIAKSIVLEMHHLIKTKKQRVSFRADSAIPPMMLDPKLIRIVIQNLISNAVKYTPPKGSVKIAFELLEEGSVFHKKTIPVKSLGFSVQDTGIGIPEKDQDKIFTKLFRAGNVAATDTEGTGLGLYVAKSVVEVSGGMIWFESQEGKGTSFYASIPWKGMEKKAGTKRLS